MTAYGGFATPGQGALVETSEREILWGRDDAQLASLFRNVVVDSTTRDAGNSPTTVLRRGLIMGKLSASGQYTEWDADASDGSQYIEGVLNNEILIADFGGTAVDRMPLPLILRAPVIASKLLIQGSAFVGHVDEFLARRVMVEAGYVFDDDPFGYLAGMGDRYETVTGTSDTLTASQNGMTLIYSSASAVAVTLPTIQPGLSFDIVRTGDEEIVVSSAAGDDMIVGNDLSADSLTFTTAGQHMGTRVRLRAVYVSTTLKWLVELPNMPFGTGLTGGFTYAIAS